MMKIFWKARVVGIFVSNQDLELEPLLVAGLQSKLRNIKNPTVSFWNETFGVSQTIHSVSNELKVVLESLSKTTQICVPPSMQKKKK